MILKLRYQTQIGNAFYKGETSTLQLQVIRFQSYERLQYIQGITNSSERLELTNWSRIGGNGAKMLTEVGLQRTS
jgi:hypothetical protein